MTVLQVLIPLALHEVSTAAFLTATLSVSQKGMSAAHLQELPATQQPL